MKNDQNDGVHQKKIFIVFSIARMIQGEWIFVKTERAFEKEESAKDLMHVLKAQYTKDGKVIPVTLQTEQGEVSCFCEIGAADVELELENKGENNE